MNQQNFLNGADQITENWEVTADGRFRLFFDQAAPDEATQQPVKHGLRQMILDFDDQFYLSGINTLYRRVVLDNAGNIIRSYDRLTPHSMNAPDLQFFVRNLAPQIRPSITNGFVRGPLGRNRTPLYDPMGRVINYTPEQLAAAPTRDYHLYNADGTPINGATTPEPEPVGAGDPEPTI